jgi:hypothetical protein
MAVGMVLAAFTAYYYGKAKAGGAGGMGGGAPPPMVSGKSRVATDITQVDFAADTECPYSTRKRKTQ